MELDAGIAGFPRCLGSKIFCHIGLGPAGLVCIEQGAGLIAHKVSRLDLDEGLGNRELDALILADGASENLPLAGICRNTIDEPVAIADTFRRNQRALGIQAGHNVFEPFALFPDQVFSRVHVDDIASGVVAALTGNAPRGAYNLGDDLPASQNMVVEEACALLGIDPPPLISLDEADLSPMARGFYAENRRVANLKAKRVLRWQPRYPTYREGLRSLL